MAKFLNNVLLIFVLYIYLYNPYLQVLGTGAIKLIWLMALVYFTFKPTRLLTVLKFKVEFAFIFLILGYTALISFLHSGANTAIPYNYLIFIVDCLIVPIAITAFFKKSLDIQDIDNKLIVTGLIAAVISVFLVVNPEVNTYIRDNIILDELDTADSVGYLKYIRGFTIAESSTFGYGVIQGLVFSLILHQRKVNYYYLVGLLPIVVSIMFNARVGFMVILIGGLMSVKRIRISVVATALVIYFFASVYFVKSEFYADNEASIEWALSFFTESLEFLTGDTSGNTTDKTTYDALNTSFFFPESLTGLVFGEARITMGYGSDVGYINQIFSGGLVLLVLLLLFLAFLAYRFYSIHGSMYLLIIFFVSLLVVNFKGPALFTSLSFFRLIMLYYILVVTTFYSLKANSLEH